jgi:hypothetical protein
MLLFDSRVDPTVDDNYPFRIACQCGHVAIVKLLLEIAYVDPCADHNYAIISAFNTGSFEVCSIILRDHRFDRATLEESAIHVGDDDVKLLVLLEWMPNIINKRKNYLQSIPEEIGDQIEEIVL